MSDFDFEEAKKIAGRVYGGYKAAAGAAAALPAAGAAFNAGIPLALAVPGAPVAFAVMTLGAGAALGYFVGAGIVKVLFGK